MKNVKYGFVILHYMAENMTIRCVNNLLQHFGDLNIIIVIVDNGSSNGSGERIKRYFECENKVITILSKKNLGFARGNNIGYQFLKHHYDVSFMIVMNNDVFIKQDNFLFLLDGIYTRTSFGVLGPDIYSPYANFHQNPVKSSGIPLSELKKLIHKRENEIKYFPFFYLYKKTKSFFYKSSLIYKAKEFAKKRIFHIPMITREEQKCEQIDYLLQGACYIFSKKFINQRDVAFNPNTFLFFEEEILYWECKNAKIPMVYTPNLHVIHLEDISINTVYKSNYKKMKMKLGEELKSMHVLEKLMEIKNKG